MICTMTLYAYHRLLRLPLCDIHIHNLCSFHQSNFPRNRSLFLCQFVGVQWLLRTKLPRPQLPIRCWGSSNGSCTQQGPRTIIHYCFWNLLILRSHLHLSEKKNIRLVQRLNVLFYPVILHQVTFLDNSSPPPLHTNCKHSKCISHKGENLTKLLI